jgi:hypothetical protein
MAPSIISRRRAIGIVVAACVPLGAGRLTAQGLVPSIGLAVSPPSPGVYGQPVTLRVRPASLQARYRFVATMIVTGTGKTVAGTSCANPQNIGMGMNASWTPASGAYRLTVHSIRRPTSDDSASVSYQVDAPNAGFLNVTIMQTQNHPPGQIMLSLNTADRGTGVRYQWVVRFTSTPGTPQNPPVDWTGDTPTHGYSVPLVLPPGTYNVSARVGIHQGDPCRIVETSRGVIANRVIQ